MARHPPRAFGTPSAMICNDDDDRSSRKAGHADRPPGNHPCHSHSAPCAPHFHARIPALACPSILSSALSGTAANCSNRACPAIQQPPEMQSPAMKPPATPCLVWSTELDMEWCASSGTAPHASTASWSAMVPTAMVPTAMVPTDRPRLTEHSAPPYGSRSACRWRGFHHTSGASWPLVAGYAPICSFICSCICPFICPFAYAVICPPPADA